MAGRSLSSEYSGIHLTHDHDDLLHKISRYFTKIDRVNALAIKLFLGSATGGAAFVAQLEKDSTPANKAFKVLDEWRTQYYEKAYGGYLYEVLKKPDVDPVAATECKSQLCPLNPAQESQTATTSSPQKKQPRPGGVNAVWTSSSGRFAVILDEKLSSKIPHYDLSSPLREFFGGLLGNTGHVSFLEKSEDMLQLMCVSVGVKLDCDFTAKQLEERLTSPLASNIGLPPSRLQCHKVIPSKFGSVKCVYSLPMKKADSLLQKWSDVEKAQELQEIFSELPALITPSRPISSITDTLDEALWEFSTHSANPSQLLCTSSTNFKPTAEKRLYESTYEPQEIASSSTLLANESSTPPAKRRKFDHSAEQQQLEALDEAADASVSTDSRAFPETNPEKTLHVMPRRKISDELIVQVADKVTTIRDCNRLAASLDVDLDDVESEKESGMTRPSDLALSVLRQWKRNNGPGATAKTLFDILNKNARLRYLTEVLEPAEERTGTPSQQTAQRSNDATALQGLSSSAHGGQPSSSAGHHNSSTMSPQQQGVMLRDVRNPLFPHLADTRWPFSLAWQKIFRSLPIVASVKDSSRRFGLQLAYPYPESEIDNIKSNIQTQYGWMNNSECLQAALNKWLNDRGGYASVGQLFDVLASSTVNLSSSAQTFFEDYFKNHHHEL